MPLSPMSGNSRRSLGLDPVVALSLAVAIIFFLISGTVGYFNLLTLQSNMQKIVHSHDVIVALDELLSSTQDAETGQRGFLLTNNERYLAPYNSAVMAIPAKLDEIAQATSDNPSQKPRIAALRLHVAAKLAAMSQEEAVLRLKRLAEMSDAQKTAIATSFLSGLLGVLLTLAIGFLIRRATLARQREAWLQSGQVGLASVVFPSNSPRHLLSRQ